MNDKSKTSRSTGNRKKRGFGKWLFRSFILIAVALFCLMAGYLFVILNGERLLATNVNKIDMDEATIVYDAKGQEAMRISRENREIITLEQMPKLLRDAFVATEDKRFYEHKGIDYFSIGRALVTDIVQGSMVEGGSTITQQLAKNLFLSNEKTLFRKATEASIALALENNYSKDDILEMYLNRIYFGNGAYGVKAAAKTYFGVTDLTDPKAGLKLWQIATLAGIPKAPSYYNPVDDPDRSKQRRQVVLKLMYEQGLISKSDMEQAGEVAYKPLKANKQTYPSFANYIIREAEEMAQIGEAELRRGGYKIYTTLDIKAQQAAEAAFADGSLFPQGTKEESVQGAMAIVNNSDGGIVAIVGGRGYKLGDFNRALAKRQPGSSFKPIAVYGPALETGNWTPDSLLTDQKMSFGDYAPRNYDGKYLGQVSMTQAVRNSINVPAVWLLHEIGIGAGMKFAAQLGINLGPEDRNLAIALGGLTNGVSPLQMARAYAAFANQGTLHKAHAISKITDTHASGEKPIYQFRPESARVMSEKTAWYMTQMLEDVVQRGTGKNARMNRPVAGKTGTTQTAVKGVASGNRDVWFVGYTPEWTGAVWMGYDQTDKETYLQGGSGIPAKMFARVMTAGLSGVKVTPFARPKGAPAVAEPPAAKITDLTAQYSAQDRQVIVSWTAPKGDWQYRLYRKTAEDPEFVMLLPTAETSVRDLTVQPGKTYQYCIAIVVPGTELEGERSGIVEIAVPEDAIVSPEPTLPAEPTPTDGMQEPTPTLEPSETPSPLPQGESPTPTPGDTATPSTEPEQSTAPQANAG